MRARVFARDSPPASCQAAELFTASMTATMTATLSPTPSPLSNNTLLEGLDQSFLGTIAFPDKFFFWNLVTWGLAVVYLTFFSKASAKAVSFLVNKLYFRGECGACTRACLCVCMCERVYVCVCGGGGWEGAAFWRSLRCAWHGCAGVRVCGCAGVRVCGCAGVRVCGCAGVRVCGCAGVRVCGCAGVRVCGRPRALLAWCTRCRLLVGSAAAGV
jgi:hypothetical protein